MPFDLLLTWAAAAVLVTCGVLAGCRPMVKPVDPPTKRGHVFEQNPAADVTTAAGSDVKILVHATKGPVPANV